MIKNVLLEKKLSNFNSILFLLQVLTLGEIVKLEDDLRQEKPPNVRECLGIKTVQFKHLLQILYWNLCYSAYEEKDLACVSKSKKNYLLKQGYAKYLKNCKQDIWRKEGTFVVNQNACFTNTLNFLQR